MVRKQIYIAPEQDKMLKKLARQGKKTEAQVIREALEEYTRMLNERALRMEAWRAIEATAERMKKQPATTAGRNWTREDLYDRYERSSAVRHKRSGVRV